MTAAAVPEKTKQQVECQAARWRQEIKGRTQKIDTQKTRPAGIKGFV